MEKLPLELLSLVADYLNAKDLSHFRQAGRKLAQAGIILIPRNGLSVLDICGGFGDLQKVLHCSEISRHTRQLNIFSGEWPQCTRAEWETHPLLFQGNSRIEALDPFVIENIYGNYVSFVENERCRRQSDCVTEFHDIIKYIPNLEAINVSNMDHWIWHPTSHIKYAKLMKRIWLAPRVKHSIASAVQRCLLGVHHSSVHVKSLNFKGILNPAEVRLNSGFEFYNVQYLSLDNFYVSSDEKSILAFFQIFPNLVKLSVKFHISSPRIPSFVGKLSWPYLMRLYISNLWVSEEDIFRLIQNHQPSLKALVLRDLTLTKGSWKSLFSRIKSLHLTTTITATGELYGRSRKNTLQITNETQDLLIRFLREASFSWPF